MAIRVNHGRLLQSGALVAACEQHPELNELMELYLQRHLMGDWGDLDPDDAAANDHAVICGGRVFSSYELLLGLAASTGESKVWIITEADRSTTTILYPSEY